MTTGDDKPSVRLAAAGRAASKRRNYLLAGTLLVLALLAGMIIGVSSTVLYFERHLPDHKPRRGPKAMTDSMISRMEKAVSITDAEREELRQIVTDTMLEVHAVREEFSGRMRVAFEDMNVDVARVLGPERYAKWDEAKHAYFAEQAKRDKRHWYNRRRAREEREERERREAKIRGSADTKHAAPETGIAPGDDEHHADE